MVSTHSVKRLITAIAAVMLAMAPHLGAQDKSKPASCPIVAITRPGPKFPAKIRSLASYRSPIIACRIEKTGEVTQVRIKRSSNVPEIDEAALRAIRKWKYEPVPCGPVDVEIGFTIDFR